MLRINAILNESYVSMTVSRRCCFFMLLGLYVSCCISNFKVYLRTLDIEHRIYRRKRNLLNLPYSPMITICSLSTVMICVKRSQIWCNGYCPCYMFHVFFFVFFSCLFLHFNYISISSTTSPDNRYCQLPCVVLS